MGNSNNNNKNYIKTIKKVIWIDKNVFNEENTGYGSKYIQ